MKNQIAIATKKFTAATPQAFTVSAHFSKAIMAGAILVNLQERHNKYVVWSINFAGDLFTGFYTDDYAAAAADFNGRLLKIVDQELAKDSRLKGF